MNSFDPSQLKDNLHLLLIGPPGGGKTPLALQFPRVGYIDCDQNLSGPVRWLLQQGLYKDFKHFSAVKDEKGQPVPLDQQWARINKAADECIADPEIETIILDSLTYCDNAIIMHICRIHKLDELEGYNWSKYKRILHDFLAKCKSSGKYFIVTCHEKIVTDQKGNVLKYNPSISSGISDYLGYYFTDIWRCTIENMGAGKMMQQVKPYTSSTLFDAKNSLLFNKVLENPTWATIKAAIDAKIIPKVK